jgi:hypothetical protein
MLLLIISGLHQCLLLHFSPHSSKRVSLICLFNELAVSLNLYLSLLLTDYLSQQLEHYNDNSTDTLSTLRLYIAWIITALLIATIFVNFVHTLTLLSASLIAYLRSKCQTAASIVKS